MCLFKVQYYLIITKMNSKLNRKEHNIYISDSLTILGKDPGNEVDFTSRFKAAKYKNLQLIVHQSGSVSLQVLGQCFAFFSLNDQLVPQQKCLLEVEESCSEKQSAGLL